MVWKGAEIKETKENTFDGFALFLRNAEFMIVKNILATVCIPLFSLLRYKSLCVVQPFPAQEMLQQGLPVCTN
jgi:hypothetical protein